MNKIKSMLLFFSVFLMSQTYLFCDNWTIAFSAFAKKSDPIQAAQYILSNKGRFDTASISRISGPLNKTPEVNATAYYLGGYPSMPMASREQLEKSANAIINGNPPYGTN